MLRLGQVGSRAAVEGGTTLAGPLTRTAAVTGVAVQVLQAQAALAVVMLHAGLSYRFSSDGVERGQAQLEGADPRHRGQPPEPGR